MYGGEQVMIAVVTSGSRQRNQRRDGSTVDTHLVHGIFLVVLGTDGLMTLAKVFRVLDPVADEFVVFVAVLVPLTLVHCEGFDVTM